MRGPPPRGPPSSRGRGGYYPGPSRSASAARMGEPPIALPGRSATMPSGAPPMMYPAGPQQTFSDYDYASSPISPVEAPLRPSTAGGMRHPPRPINEIDPGLMIPPPPDPSNRVSYAPKEFLDSYYESGDEPEMPNFDAMPQTHMGPIDEMGLDTPRPAVQTPTSPPVTSPSGAYSPYTPESASGIPQSHLQPNMGNASGPNQFENAGFHFDIPTEPPRQPEGYIPNSYEANGAGPYQNQARAPEPQHNPDALPVHPTPFRPGLDQKPPPIRLYNTAPITASAPAPTPTVGPQPARPVSMGPTPVTQEELQQLQQKVRGNPSDQASQLLLAKKLVEAATVLIGDNNRLDPKTKAKAKEKYIMDAHKIVKKLVQAGYADAQFYLADCYGEGQLGLEADPKEAFALYHSAAKSGHAQSAYRVAVCSEIGQEEGGGTKRDPFKAVQWYKRAAALGDTPAMYKMGMIHLKGLLGQARNPREGVSWLKRAAERADEENPHALHELALMYQNAGGNDVIIRDEKYANQLFHQAADLGYKFSQFRLGTAYEYGLMGNPVDNRMSIIWYTRAAAQGEHQSELALSGWYLTGSEGILQQNDTEAYLWARKAATAGLAKAEYAMGYFTEVGIGVSANLEDAKRWYWRAACESFLNPCNNYR
ncbi:uncharacterized protein N7477_005959 [Penicillium maclennaniae]|uniref:uncharacterized protein n=1 Tax=Penicillium maclennaniae TaxID=1343394 RepID=UPI00253FF36F|nr:uncharacterized protein N7477_005959 [Penicillium maclennaniae]KAJ5670596.1 hypothetical protein N7477_005959 [Penicillium maclennaniae]